jgi:hypothetical protein
MRGDRGRRGTGWVLILGASGLGLLVLMAGIGLAWAAVQRNRAEQEALDLADRRAREAVRVEALSGQLAGQPEPVRAFVARTRALIVRRPVELMNDADKVEMKKCWDYFNMIEMGDYLVESAELLGADRYARTLRLEGKRAKEFERFFALCLADVQRLAASAFQEVEAKGFRKASVESKAILLGNGFSAYMDNLPDYP